MGRETSPKFLIGNWISTNSVDQSHQEKWWLMDWYMDEINMLRFWANLIHKLNTHKITEGTSISDTGPTFRNSRLSPLRLRKVHRAGQAFGYDWDRRSNHLAVRICKNPCDSANVFDEFQPMLLKSGTCKGLGLTLFQFLFRNFCDWNLEQRGIWMLLNWWVQGTIPPFQTDPTTDGVCRCVSHVFQLWIKKKSNHFASLKGNHPFLMGELP